MRKKKNPSGNLKFATLFTILVAGLIILSLILKFFLLVGASKFDAVNSLTVLVRERGGEQVINFSPKSQSISILTLDNAFYNPSKKFEIPIDSSFKSGNKATPKNLSTTLAKKILDFKDQKEITFMDFLRLFLYSNTVREPNITEGSISSETSLEEVSRITSSFFVDPKILEEKESIEVVNATGIFGLGNKLGNLINNMGGNVILVTTGENEAQSRVEYARKSYTAKRLSNLLDIKLVETKKKSIPDIIIVIGKDKNSSDKF